MDCAARFKKDVAALPGVTRAELNFGASLLTVEGVFNPEAVVREGARHDIGVLPEGAAVRAQRSYWQRHKRGIISGLAGLALVLGWFFQLAGEPPVSITFYLAAAATGSAYTVRKAFFSLKKFHFDMNVLMVVAVTGAVLIGEWAEAAVVAFLFSVSNTLESYTMEKARQSIRELMNIAPRDALIRRNNREIVMPVDQIRVGDIMIVRPGEKIAMDGRVVRGSSCVNQAPITGESIPAEKDVGDEVFAGTVNQDGALEVEVTKLVSDTTISKIIHMVEEAQSRRAPSQAFVDRFAAVYTPIVLFLAAGIALIPPLVFGSPWGSWIYRGLALMVVSCPCALVVSTPVALVAAIGNAARNGVLIKGGVYLEETGALSAVAFDKTGTLTTGEPTVTDVVAVGSSDNVQVLAIAASIEQLSEHPLARAIVARAREKQINLVRPEGFKAIAGKGARVRFSGEEYIIGSPRLFEDAGIPIAEIAPEIERLQEQGKTVMVCGTERGAVGLLAVADRIRESSRMAIRELKRAGVRTVMLTGDNTATAQAVAGQAGVDEFEAELLPEHKVDAVQRLLARYKKVAMVGDGINDAPALAMATVGIAMGGVGTDVALETADIALMADDLLRLPFTIRLSRAALRVIKQNIFFALAVKLLAVLLVFPGWLTLWLAILADMGASILVTLNGIRLLRVTPKNRVETGN